MRCCHHSRVFQRISVPTSNRIPFSLPLTTLPFTTTVSLLVVWLVCWTKYCDCVEAFASVSPSPVTTSFLNAASVSSTMTDSNTASNEASSLLQNAPFLETLTVTANAYAAAHGLQVETKPTQPSTSANVLYQMAPMSLLPQAYPAAAFASAQRLAPHFSRLVELVAGDAAFLHQTLGGSVATQDAYTAKLLQLYFHIYHPTFPTAFAAAAPELPAALRVAAQSADRLGILRSDYMLHRRQENEYTIQQVELNTIASSFAGLACQVAQLHRYLLARYGAASSSVSNNDLDQFLLDNQRVIRPTDDMAAPAAVGVPKNPTFERLPRAMHLAVQRYRARFHTPTSTDPCGILFVVQPGETNTVDQRMLEFQLWDTYGIPVIRRSLAQIQAQVERDECTGALSIRDPASGNMEIAVVYYRAGYAPTDYPGGDLGVEWQARALLEASRATKCPGLGYHLAGTKKVQQQLSRPGVLEQFFPGEPVVVAELRQAFAGLYSLGEDASETDQKAVRDVFHNYHKYVLKPQREGGGYNFYGEQLLQKIKDNVVLSDEEVKLSEALGEFILMERLFPPQQTAILLRAGKVEGNGLTISELGCFGTILVAGDAAKEDAVVHNEYAGFLLRTKFSNVDEGGVASGFATLSSPYLC
jgi:glutathione synthase